MRSGPAEGRGRRLLMERADGNYSPRDLTPMMGAESITPHRRKAMFRALAYLVICSNETVARLIRALAA